MAIPWKQFFSGSSEKIAQTVGGILPPSFIKKAKGQISDRSTNYSTSNLSELATSAANSKELIKLLVENSPDASQAASSIARVAITDSYSVVAYNLDGTINIPATVAAATLANRLDKLRPNYTNYNIPNDFRALSERAIKQMCITGSFGSELVLGKGKIPEKINIFSTLKIKYEERNGVVVPYFQQNGQTYYLDSPLVIIEDLDQDVDTLFSSSPYSAAIQPILADFEFINDLRRAFSKANLPRPTAKILTEKIKEAIPTEIKIDPVKYKAYMDEIIESVRSTMNDLRPEDALVYHDIIEVDHLSAGNISSHNAVKEHKELLNGKVASGLQTLPSILGRGANSTTSSTEAMLYLRAAEGVQEKLNHMFSQHLTVGVRLFGHECYVEFSYADPDLRPKLELETFRTQKQSRIRELLSDGWISDEEASIMLTGGLPSGNFETMSGTKFFSGAATSAGNPYSNTSVDGGLNDTQSGKNQKAKDQKPSSNKTTGQ